MDNETLTSDSFIFFCQYQKSLQSALSLTRSDSYSVDTHTRNSFDRAWIKLSPCERFRWMQKFQLGYEKVAIAQKDQIARICSSGAKPSAIHHAA